MPWGRRYTKKVRYLTPNFRKKRFSCFFVDVCTPFPRQGGPPEKKYHLGSGLNQQDRATAGLFELDPTGSQAKFSTGGALSEGRNAQCAHASTPMIQKSQKGIITRNKIATQTTKAHDTQSDTTTKACISPICPRVVIVAFDIVLQFGRRCNCHKFPRGRQNSGGSHEERLTVSAKLPAQRFPNVPSRSNFGAVVFLPGWESEAPRIKFVHAVDNFVDTKLLERLWVRLRDCDTAHARRKCSLRPDETVFEGKAISRIEIHLSCGDEVSVRRWFGFAHTGRVPTNYVVETISHLHVRRHFNIECKSVRVRGNSNRYFCRIKMCCQFLSAL